MINLSSPLSADRLVMRNVSRLCPGFVRIMEDIQKFGVAQELQPAEVLDGVFAVVIFQMMRSRSADVLGSFRLS